MLSSGHLYHGAPFRVTETQSVRPPSARSAGTEREKESERKKEGERGEGEARREARGLAGPGASTGCRSLRRGATSLSAPLSLESHGRCPTGAIGAAGPALTALS